MLFALTQVSCFHQLIPTCVWEYMLRVTVRIDYLNVLPNHSVLLTKSPLLLSSSLHFEEDSEDANAFKFSRCII